MRRVVALGIVLCGLASPAMAWQHRADWQHRAAWQHRRAADFCLRYADADACYWHAQHIIHRKFDRIAYLEADPDVDEGFKGPIIRHARAKIHWLRRAVGIRHIVWPGPCCYSRPPVYVR